VFFVRICDLDVLILLCLIGILLIRPSSTRLLYLLSSARLCSVSRSALGPLAFHVQVRCLEVHEVLVIVFIVTGLSNLPFLFPLDAAFKIFLILRTDYE